MKRSEAKLAGAKIYHFGKPCRLGHEAGRWTSNGRCVECSKAAFREWNAKNTEYSIAKSREWRQSNAERHLEQARVRASQRYLEKKQDCLAYAKKYRSIEQNRQKSLVRAREWAASNQDVVREHKRKSTAIRRARKRNVGGAFTLGDVAELFQKQSGKCAYFGYCGHVFLGSKYHIDHVKPLARGGSNFKENLQLLCAPCNMKKAARNPQEFAAMIGLSA